MSHKYPIYVISKGRSNNCLTARELTKMNTHFFLVVEESEADYYRSNYPDCDIIIVDNFSDQGCGSIPVRNWVWQHSIDRGDFRHWILDDNLEAFNRLNRNEKYKVADGTVFECCEDFVDRYQNIGLAGMNYYSFCKTTDPVPAFYLNTRIYSCILIDNALAFRWRGKYNEDTDLSIRVLKSGLCTVLFNAFLCGKVTTMRMNGGNTEDVYGQTDNRREFAESLKKQHPDCVEVVWKFNRWHHKVDYRRFKTNKLIYKDGIEITQGINNYGMELKESK